MAELHTVWDKQKQNIWSQINNKNKKFLIIILKKKRINIIKDKLFSYNRYIHMK